MNIVESDSDEAPIDYQNLTPLQPRRRIRGITYWISMALIDYIDYIVRAVAIFDLILCFIVIIFAVFMAIQQGKLLRVRMTPLMWTSLVLEIISSVFVIGLLRFIVKKKFKLPSFTYYILLRLLITMITKAVSISNNVM